MRVSRALPLALLGSVLVGTNATAQQWNDSFRWYLGAQAGVFGFETPSQTRGWVPTVGGQLVVVAKRTGLIVQVDEAFGTNEETAFGDNSANGGVRDVTFDRLRKYSAILTGYPIRGQTQPYVGVGFGILQAINPQPTGFFTSNAQFSLAKDQADQRSANGFVSFVAGVQFRLGRLTGFGQYQITTSPSAGHLLQGPSHTIGGGVRFSLGGSKEGVRGGGY